MKNSTPPKTSATAQLHCQAARKALWLSHSITNYIDNYRNQPMIENADCYVSVTKVRATTRDKDFAVFACWGPLSTPHVLRRPPESRRGRPARLCLLISHGAIDRYLFWRAGEGRRSAIPMPRLSTRTQEKWNNSETHLK